MCTEVACVINFDDLSICSVALDTFEGGDQMIAVHIPQDKLPTVAQIG